jgi:exodeoxyribonuclease V alpha subunit
VQRREFAKTCAGIISFDPQRNLLYTGVTRGKRLVVLVGQNKAVAIAVRNISGRRRWSKLAEWLSADVSKRYVRA